MKNNLLTTNSDSLHHIFFLEFRTMSYMELMQTASILPLAGLAVVCVLYALHMECVHLVTQDENKEHQRILHDR